MINNEISIDNDVLMQINAKSLQCAEKIIEASSNVKRAAAHDNWFCPEMRAVEDSLNSVVSNMQASQQQVVNFALEVKNASTRFEQCIRRANKDFLFGTSDVKMWEVVNDVYGGEIITPPGPNTVNWLSIINHRWLHNKDSNEFQGTTLDVYNSMIGAGIVTLPFHSWMDSITAAIDKFKEAIANAVSSSSYQVPPINISGGYYNEYNSTHQCTSYAKGRMGELGFDFSDVNANGDYFCGQAWVQGKGTYVSFQDAMNGEILNLDCPALCSCYGGVAGGHIMVIEKVEVVNGKTMIWYSQGNSDGKSIYNPAKDGVVSGPMAWEDFSYEYFQKDLPGMMDGLAQYSIHTENGGGTRTGYPFGFLKINR